ncbi:serine/threonine-protein kinase HipA [Bradyrhizobium sp. USDA 4341]
MKVLTVQTFFDGAWHDAAQAKIVQPELGYRGPSEIEYHDRYFLEHGAIPLADDRPVKDLRAYSVKASIDMMPRNANTWPAFLLDFMPQGHQAERIAKFLGLPACAAATEIHLIERSAGSPVGNLRIKEAHDMEVARIAGMAHAGVAMDDILRRSDAFMEVVNEFSMLASGSNGLQGDWPKVALTQAADRLWYPDPMVSDDDARAHVIVKLLRSRDEGDRRILESEAGYSKVAREFGLHVEGVSTYGHGALVIPRFDRAVTKRGLERYGQESLVSALGVAEFGYAARHETYLRLIQDVSNDPLRDTIEYLLRDIMNLAMGNPDNHGRNTALRKFPDGTTRLAPLFDFAPMRIDASAIARSTTWASMRPHGLDTNPDWQIICEAVARPNVPAEALMEALAEKEDALRRLPETARKHGVPDSVVTNIIVRNDEMADGVAKLRCAPKYG